MTYRNLTPKQNTRVADLLIGAAKIIFTASVVGYLFPPAGQDRPTIYAIIGIVLSGALAWIGVLLAKDEETSRAGRR